MQNYSADSLPSLSVTSPTNDIIERPFSAYHDATKPFPTPDPLPKATRKPMTNKANEAAVQAAKREVLCKLREDWEWPPTKTQAIITNPTDSLESWRERDSDSSYSLPTSEPEPDPYKFDNPDSLAQPVLSRKRKRREALQDELRWNEGLRTYMERRDAWTGARTEPQPYPIGSPYSTPNGSTNHITNSENFPPTPDSPTIPLHAQSCSSLPPQSSSPTTLLPIAPPLISPTNPVRASISPTMYPQIYSKVIVQGLTPTVPINLKHVVSAMVQGWKKDGEWPPKTEAEKKNGDLPDGNEGTVGQGRKAVRRSMGRMKKALGLGIGIGIGIGIDGPARGDSRMQE